MENFRIKVFRAVAQHLSFTRAAQELLLTQPAVTAQIKALEEEYAVPLFDRGGGRITLTAAGAALLPYATQLKEISDRAFEAVSAAAGTQAGTIALGASQTIGQYLLPRLIAAFLRDHPRIQITALSGNTDAMLVELLSHRIQLALIEGPSERNDLHIQPFLSDQMVLVVPTGHEWANRIISIDALRTAPLVMRELGSGSRRVVEDALERAGLPRKRLNISIELDSTEGLLSAVEAGLGVTFVSRWAVRNQLALGTLRTARVRLEGANSDGRKALRLTRKFSVAYPAGPAPTGVTGAFLRFLLAQKQPA